MEQVHSMSLNDYLQLMRFFSPAIFNSKNAVHIKVTSKNEGCSVPSQTSV